MKVRVKTKEQLLKEGWYINKHGDLMKAGEQWYIIPDMFDELGKIIDIDEWGRSTKNLCMWPRSTTLTKKDIINEFFSGN